MVGVSSEVVSLIYHLLPGFLAAWVFYGLTAHPKQSPFERAVHALILTAIVQAIVILFRRLFLTLGSTFGISVGIWNENTGFLWSMIWGAILGHLLAFVANNNWYHSALDKVGVTRRTSYPSEWYSAFANEIRYIILHLEGERRLMGWPFEWPDQPDSGHFALKRPHWILDDNTQVPIDIDELLLVPASQVSMVDFLKFSNETEGLEASIRSAEETLIALQAMNNPKDKNEGADD